MMVRFKFGAIILSQLRWLFRTVFGTAHFLEHMAYKTTQTRSTLRMARDFELIGARVSAAASRETVCVMT